MRELMLDANVLVRFLVQDVPQQAKAARKLVEQAEYITVNRLLP